MRRGGRRAVLLRQRHCLLGRERVAPGDRIERDVAPRGLVGEPLPDVAFARPGPARQVERGRRFPRQLPVQPQAVADEDQRRTRGGPQVHHRPVHELLETLRVDCVGHGVAPSLRSRAAPTPAGRACPGQPGRKRRLSGKLPLGVPRMPGEAITQPAWLALAADEAARRLATHGPNLLEPWRWRRP